MRPAVAGQASSRHNGGEVSQALHQGVATETASRAKNTEFLRALSHGFVYTWTCAACLPLLLECNPEEFCNL